MDINKLLEVAKSQLGTTEGYNQKVKYNDAYWGAGKYGAWAHWCAAFVWWCFRESGNLAALKNKKTAAVAGYWDVLKSREIKSAKDIRPGDLMFIWYRDSAPHHIGIVASKAESSGLFYTIEGNTSRQGSGGSERNGEGVYRKVHRLGAKCKVARPYWDSAPQTAPDVFPLSSGWVFADGGVQFYDGRSGAYREHIKWLQQRLNEQGSSLDVDGVIGAKTTAAIVQFQKSAGLEADGKVGAMTWNALKQGAGSWQEDEGGKWYKNANGTYPANSWKQIAGSWYYFNNQGYTIRNATQWIDGKLYAFRSDGSLIVGSGSITTDTSGVIVTFS